MEIVPYKNYSSVELVNSRPVYLNHPHINKRFDSQGNSQYKLYQDDTPVKRNMYTEKTEYSVVDNKIVFSGNSSKGIYIDSYA